MAYMMMPMYNIDKPVGPLQANQSDDVRLLQTMLNDIAKVSKEWTPGFPLPVNGIYTDELSLWIRGFQEKMGLPVTGKALPMQVTAPKGRHLKIDWQATAADGSVSLMYVLNIVMRRGLKAGHDGLRARLQIAERSLVA